MTPMDDSRKIGFSAKVAAARPDAQERGRAGVAAVTAGAAGAATAQPSRQHIRCLECGYQYNLTGRMGKTNCPKCRAALDLAGYTIADECRGELKTLGTIRIKAGAQVAGAHLVARDLILGGCIAGSAVEIFEFLVVQAGADFVRHEVVSADLRIETGADLAFTAPAVYRNVEVQGRLRARLYCTGLLTIRPGGLMTGDVCGARLQVDDGGGLVGMMRISPEGGEEAEKARELYANGKGATEEHVVAAGYAPMPPTVC